MKSQVDIFTYILPLITLIIGWLLNLLSTMFIYKRTIELEKKKLIQTKIEELTQLIDEVSKAYMKIWVKIKHSGTDVDFEGVNLPFVRIKILISFYFPELKPEYEILLKERDDFGNKILPVLIETDKVKRSQLYLELTKSLQRIIKLCDETFCISASKIAQKYI